MKVNQNGKVELHDFQIENFVTLTESNINRLIKCDDSVTTLVAGFMQNDLNHFKKVCGMEEGEVVS